MRLLIKQVSIADPHSPHHGLVKDMLITDGIIESISDQIEGKDVRVFEAKGLYISCGWVDPFAHFNDPGLEHKETLETGAATASAGGYTHVFALPNTRPVTDQKTAVEYIVQKSKSLPVTIHPLGAISKKTEGKEPAEMYDMYHSGAIAFSDGLQPVQMPALMLKALQYVKAISGVIIQMPIEKSIGSAGLMNEGIASTQLGMAGIPSLAEELIVSRDIELTTYTASRLHITGISTAKSVALIRQAKAAGTQVTCSVTPYHLWFCDEDLADYDTNLKVNPPLRSREDMMALRSAVLDGTIDCIASHHMPHEWDSKVCEFEYAQPGMIGLETAFAVVNTILPDLSIERITELFTGNARNIFFPKQSTIQENEPADLTIFSRLTAAVYEKTQIKSKSSNTPFLHKKLQGKAIGTVHKDNLYLTD